MKTVRVIDTGVVGEGFVDAVHLNGRYRRLDHDPFAHVAAAVAREIGTLPALIHNQCPNVAGPMRKVQGRSSHALRDLEHKHLLTEWEMTHMPRRGTRFCCSRSSTLLPSKAKQNDPKIVALTS